jgi:hypothetical protein
MSDCTRVHDKRVLREFYKSTHIHTHRITHMFLYFLNVERATLLPTVEFRRARYKGRTNFILSQQQKEKRCGKGGEAISFNEREVECDATTVHTYIPALGRDEGDYVRNNPVNVGSKTQRLPAELHLRVPRLREAVGCVQGTKELVAEGPLLILRIGEQHLQKYVALLGIPLL